MGILCITLKERNIKRFVPNRHLPKWSSTEWSRLFGEFVIFTLFAMLLGYCNIQTESVWSVNIFISCILMR
jgi:hypothetical protein